MAIPPEREAGFVQSSRPVPPGRFGLAVFFVAALVATAWFQGGTDDHSRAHLSLVRALAEQGRVVADAFVSQTHDLAFHRGHYFIAKPPGFAVTVAPAWWLATQAGFGFEAKWKGATFLFSSLPAALAATLLLAMLLELGVSPRRAVAYAAAGFFGTGLCAYATIFVETPLVVLSLLAGVRATVRWREDGSSALVAGFCFGYAALLQYLVAFSIVPAFVLAFRGRSMTNPVRLALAAAIPVSGIFLYNLACFGNPFLFGHFTSAVAQFQQHVEGMLSRPFLPRWEALVGFGVGLRKGVLLWSPIVPVALLGLVLLARDPRRRLLSVAAGGAFLLGFLFIASVPNWDGGMMSGPRYLIPLFPLVCLGLAAFPGRGSPAEWWAFPLFASTASWSVGIWFLVTALAPFSPEWLPNPVFQKHLGDFLAARFRPFLLGSGFAGLAAPLVLAIGGGLVSARLLSAETGREGGGPTGAGEESLR